MVSAKTLFQQTGAALAIALTALAPARAQGYPNKPVTLVVPFAAGGVADVLARLLAQELKLGQAVIVDNRGGAGGTLGAAAVAKAPADGYTLLFVTAGHAGTGALYPKLPYEPVADFEPVIGLASSPVVIVVNAGAKARTLQEFVAEARANPGKLNCAGGGGGATVTNLAFESFKREQKLQISAIPYKGSAPAVTAVLAGEIDCDSDALASVLPNVKAGKLRALAVTSKKRASAMPDVPTISETVLPGFDASAWYGVLAPKGTPQAVIDKLNSEFAAAMRTPVVQERLKDLGAEPMPQASADFGVFLAAETRRWGGLIKALGLTPE